MSTRLFELTFERHEFASLERPKLESNIPLPLPVACYQWIFLDFSNLLLDEEKQRSSNTKILTFLSQFGRSEVLPTKPKEKPTTSALTRLLHPPHRIFGFFGGQYLRNRVFFLASLITYLSGLESKLPLLCEQHLILC
jgi:hypothetical protein